MFCLVYLTQVCRKNGTCGKPTSKNFNSCFAVSIAILRGSENYTVQLSNPNEQGSKQQFPKVGVSLQSGCIIYLSNASSLDTTWINV